MITKTAISVDFDGDKTPLQSKIYFRHGGPKIQASKCRTGAHLN